MTGSGRSATSQVGGPDTLVPALPVPSAAFAYHIRIDAGGIQAAHVNSYYTLRHRPDACADQPVVLVASRLDDLRRLAGSPAPGPPGHDLDGVWSDLDAAASLEAEIGRALELSELSPSLDRRSDHYRLIIESYLFHAADIARSRKILERRHARVSVVAGPSDTARAGKRSVCTVGGLADISPSTVETLFEDASARHRDLAARRAIDDYRGPVVLSPQATGVLLHEAVGHLLEADNYVSGRQPAQGVGERIAPASSGLSVRDVAPTPGCWGSVQFDDEGTPTRETMLVGDGYVVGLLTSRRFAGLSGGTSTGHGRASWPDRKVLPRLARLSMAPGDAGPDDLRALAGHHVHVEEIAWGRMNPRTRQVDLTLGGVSRVGSDGDVEPRAGGTISCRVDSLLDSLAGIGSDSRWSPSLCYKQGQGLPVETEAPTTFFADLEIHGEDRG